MSVDTLFAQWREVNQQANEAERRLFEASLSYLRGAGPAPAETERELAARLRAEARALFARALEEVDCSGAAARNGYGASGGGSGQVLGDQAGG